MLNRNINIKPLFFQADAPRGGGGDGDDPRQNDDFLAACFKFELRKSYNSSTAGTPALHECINNILQRIEQADHIILLSTDLQPIARRIMAISTYSDKFNPGVLQQHFEGFNLYVDPRWLQPPPSPV